MNELQIFDNPEFGRIRGLMLDGDPWCVGRDVAGALGYKDTKSALGDHVDPEDKQIIQRGQITTFENHLPKSAFPADFVPADIPNRGLTIINESGLYSLILSSKLPTAKRFKHWVTSEVLPAIRKTGRYEMEVPAAPARYAPTRPLTTDDYEDAARTIAKCHNSRLPLVIDLYRKAGLDIQEIPAEETPQLSDERRKADFVKLLNQYSLKDLCEKLQMPKASVYYYRIGKVFPHDGRYNEIIQILEG